MNCCRIALLFRQGADRICRASWPPIPALVWDKSYSRNFQVKRQWSASLSHMCMHDTVLDLLFTLFGAGDTLIFHPDCFGSLRGRELTEEKADVKTAEVASRASWRPPATLHFSFPHIEVQSVTSESRESLNAAPV